MVSVLSARIRFLPPSALATAVTASLTDVAGPCIVALVDPRTSSAPTAAAQTCRIQNLLRGALYPATGYLAASHAASGGDWRASRAAQFSTRSIDCSSPRSTAGVGFLAKNALISAAALVEHIAPSPPTTDGMPWKTPSLSTSAFHWAVTNAHVASRAHGRSRRLASSVPVSCVRTDGERARPSVAFTSAGSRNQESALKNR